MTTTTTDIPAGYRRNAQGHLIPEEHVKPIDATRDMLVAAMVERALKLRAELRKFKADSFTEIAAFVEMSAEQYGAKVGGTKGNVSLVSYDGRYKVQRAIQESINFDERLQAAKALIDDCLRDWTADARSELAALINDAFRVDSAGNIRTAMVLGLRRIEIQDERWMQAMDAISDSVQVVGSKAYVRIYERVGNSDQYRPISLDLAAV